MQTDSYGRKNKSWIKSRWFLIITLSVFALISISLIKEFYRSYQINKEIENLQNEILALEGENQEIADFVEYLKTDAYFEQQARLKFGLKSDGEKVIVLQGEDENGTTIGSEEEGSIFGFNTHGDEKNRSNPVKWFNYFFGADA